MESKKGSVQWGKKTSHAMCRSCHRSFDDSGYVASKYEESFDDWSIVMTKSFANTIPAQACQTLQRDANVIYGTFWHNVKYSINTDHGFQIVVFAFTYGVKWKTEQVE